MTVDQVKTIVDRPTYFSVIWFQNRERQLLGMTMSKRSLHRWLEALIAKQI